MDGGEGTPYSQLYKGQAWWGEPRMAYARALQLFPALLPILLAHQGVHACHNGGWQLKRVYGVNARGK